MSLAGLVAILLIFSGEALSIAAEFVASKRIEAASGVHYSILLEPVFLITVGGIFLIVGYALGYSTLRNIWIISVVSIGSILILEPTLALLMFKELPTYGAAVGLALGVIGLIATFAG